MEQIRINNVYCIHITEYTYTDWFSEEQKTITDGPAIVSITEEEYNVLKANGVKTEEYTQVVFSKEGFNESSFIRQLMFKHIAYIDKANHTNF